MKKPKIKILNPEDEVPTEILAASIVEVSKAAKQLLESGLTRRAICVLIRDQTWVSLQDIGTVLDSAAQLATRYTTQRKKP